MVQSSVSGELFDNPEIRTNQQKYAILLCATEILEVKVQSVNSTLAISESHYAKDKTLVRVITGTTAAETFYSDALRQGFMLAGLEKTIENLAASFADAFSRTFVALVSGVTEPVMNSAQWDRKNRLLARIPMAPYWTLVILSLGAVLLVVVVTMMALGKATGDVTSVGQAKLRVSPEGLAALAFEDTRGSKEAMDNGGLFEENSTGGRRRKVVLAKNVEGGIDVVRHGL